MTTIIHIMTHQTFYEHYKDHESPKISWKNKKGEIVGITCREWPHLLSNEMLKLNSAFKHEVWQPDLRADKVHNHTFRNGIVYRLFPATNRKVLYGVKLINEICYQEMLIELNHFCKSKNVIIHIHGCYNILYSRHLLECHSVPIIFSCYGEIDFPYTRFFTYTLNIFSKVNHLVDHFKLKNHINRVCCINYASDKHLSHLTSIYGGMIKKIPMGCSFSFWRKLDKKRCRKKLSLPQSTFILFTGCNLGIRKQIDKFVEVLMRLKERFRFLYLVSGRGEKQYEDYLKRISEPLLKKGYMKFLGYLTEDVLLTCYNASDLYVSTAISEGGPVATMKAFACEVPVFSTRTGNAAEIMEQEKAGCLVDILNFRQWHAELSQIFEGKNISALNRDVAKSHYDWPNIAGRFLSIYRTLG